MKYRWILFDIDGTLLDFDKAEIGALESTFEGFGHSYKPSFGDRYRQINAELWQQLEAGRVSVTELKRLRFSRLFDALGVQHDAEAFGAGYLGHLSRRSDMMEGAEELVPTLASRASLMLITNGIAEVQRPRMAGSGLESYFEDFIISEEVGAAKPDPEIFEAAFRSMGQPEKRDVLIIGDSLTSDIRGGVDFGIDTCWLNAKGAPTDPALDIRYEIGRLSELPAVFEG